jgi:hypothetical protein
MHNCYFDFLIVEILNGAYNGQKLTKLVNKKITAKIPNTNAAIPII